MEGCPPTCKGIRLIARDALGNCWGWRCLAGGLSGIQPHRRSPRGPLASASGDAGPYSAMETAKITRSADQWPRPAPEQTSSTAALTRDNTFEACSRSVDRAVVLACAVAAQGIDEGRHRKPPRPWRRRQFQPTPQLQPPATLQTQLV